MIPLTPFRHFCFLFPGVIEAGFVEPQQEGY